MKEEPDDRFDLQERLVDFAVRVMTVAEELPNERAGQHVASQLIRSGTSPAANYGEAQSAESRKDFIHKMKVSLKELRETHVWLLNNPTKAAHQFYRQIGSNCRRMQRTHCNLRDKHRNGKKKSGRREKHETKGVIFQNVFAETQDH
jgi:four helix bundle protein